MAKIHLLVNKKFIYILCPEAGWEQMLPNRLSWEAGALASVVDQTFDLKLPWWGRRENVVLRKF